MRKIATMGKRAAPTCAAGHQVGFVDAEGVFINLIHRYPATADPVSGRLREVRCPACEKAVKTLTREQVRDRLGGASYAGPGLRRAGSESARSVQR
jgi:hypothetical protein